MKSVFAGVFLALLLMLLTPALVHAQQADIGWDVQCTHTQYAYIDPIVYPFQKPAGHLHQFAGNAPRENWSAASFRQHSTNCSRKADRSGYWIPAVLKPNGTRITPTNIAPYYRTRVYFGSVVKPPNGLKIIAGDAHSQTPQDLSIVFWDCKKDGEVGGRVYGISAEPRNCSGNADTPRLHVNFPQCWDGFNLDSADHKSHMAYPYSDGANYYCPSDHPVAIPMLALQVVFPARKDAGVNWNAVTFSSGGRYSMHGDFVSVWKEGSGGIGDLIKNCMQRGKVCGNR